MASPLLDLAIRRQVLLERLKSGQVRSFEKAFREIERIVKLSFSATGDDLNNQGRRHLAGFLRDLKRDLVGPLATESKLYMVELEKTAGLYAAAEAYDLGKTVAGLGTLKVPNAATSFKRALNLPMSHSGELLTDFIKSFSARETARILGRVRQGVSQGHTNSELLRSVIGTKGRNYRDGIIAHSRRNARAMIRTATQHTASSARLDLWEANQDVVKKYQWVSTLDRRTTSVCKSLDQKEFELGKGPTPPIHIQCLTGDTLITSACGISKIFKRAYEGKIIFIRTRSGNEITVTPNHPILTDRGWVGAQFVNDSDQCFVCFDSKGVKNPQGKNDTAFATVEQVAEAFGGFGQVSAREVPAAAPHFHNDPGNNKVTDILSKEDLGLIGYAPKVKHGGKVGFVFGDGETAAFHPSGNSVGNLLNGTGFAPDRFVGTLDELFPDTFRGSIHPSLLLGGSPAQGVSMFFQDSLDGTWADAEGIRNPPDTNSSEVLLDDVVAVQVRDFCGHVYNMETQDHLIKCNGIVTHNCRSTTIAVVSKEFEFLSEGRTRSAEFGPVGGDKSYFDWLKRQNKSVQIEALGPTRAQLFSEGGLSADKFSALQLDKNFRPMTLVEMQALEPLAFRKAGL